jgi:hypothetical protein
MSSHTVSELEALIDQLSPGDQLRLLEDLVHRVRARVAADREQESDSLGSQLAIMARDRDVRAELQSIDREFAPSESDGLTKD